MTDPFTADVLHGTLLRVAGWVPDDLLADARTRLAQGSVGEVARILAFAGTRSILPLIDDDLDLLEELLAEDGADPELVGAVELAAEEPPLVWRFAGRQDDNSVDGAGGDAELLAAVAGEPGVRALWRAWRWPADDAPYPPPRAVYVLEADPEEFGEDSGGLAAVTGRLQSLLAATGEQDPQVEVVAVHSDPPAYQRMARAAGTLLWAVQPAEEPVVARVFDQADDEHGPTFDADHPLMTDEDERERTLEYLRGGTELLLTLATLDDIVDPSRGAVVPMSFRTDGRWIWTDAVAYYLDEYHLAPDPELLDHIRAVDGPPPKADTVALHRAMEVLTRPPDEPVVPLVS